MRGQCWERARRGKILAEIPLTFIGMYDGSRNQVREER
jgi:hypothetical protein